MLKELLSYNTLKMFQTLQKSSYMNCHVPVCFYRSNSGVGSNL